MRAILLQPGVTGVAHDREQPGATIHATETIKKLKSTQVRLLNHIFSVMIIARQPASQIVCGAHMRQDALFKTREFVLFLQL